MHLHVNKCSVLCKDNILDKDLSIKKDLCLLCSATSLNICPGFSIPPIYFLHCIFCILNGNHEGNKNARLELEHFFIHFVQWK